MLRSPGYVDCLNFLKKAMLRWLTIIYPHKKSLRSIKQVLTFHHFASKTHSLDEVK
ncbi:hypothetical protein LSH36_1045g00057 [Paralvinella palmiformis]|uniref:Uncharacterized protein n=1 Tax=Paralvinella palmiformis TaxID=53620 RepID=A0AAD9IWV5_9ANNE|nr:hypothetical protein LSH36_1045g00057 [Paralvinella palmiformis]